ncbi:glycoside hydrolase family 10 protein [Portibacter marinus]|uniref:hypothetical protein n=1 Tax=Portibacter marinus TaxID=2898660 RepID=UPI001F2A02FD|nr:hypothetical protein [Portibacter marinus]
MLKNRCHYILLFLIIGLISLISCKQRPDKTPVIKGIYGNPTAFWDKGLKLNELGINAVFIHSGSVNHEIITRARSEGSKVFAEFATLNGKGYVNKHPEAWAINEKGEKVKPASWFMGVCPTEPNFRSYRFNLLRNLLQEYELDGVWMDYVHFHAQFEEPEPILPETCFCEHCVKTFSENSELKIPEGTVSERAEWILENHDLTWRDWRCKVILDWAVEIKSIINEIRPEALLGLYHCPWDDQEFDGANRRLLGLDYDLLKGTIDVFSPMVYHAKMGRKPDWVSENIDWLSKRLEIQKESYPKVWPIVQAYDDPRRINKQEFEMVLRHGLSGGSSGVMMFTSNAVAKDDGKIAVMKDVYTLDKQ